MDDSQNEAHTFNVSAQVTSFQEHVLLQPDSTAELYQRVSFGRKTSHLDNVRFVTLKELGELAGASITASVDYLLYSPYENKENFKMFLEFCKQNHAFISSIKEIELQTSVVNISVYLSAVSVDNLMSVKVVIDEDVEQPKHSKSGVLLYSVISSLPNTLKSLDVSELLDSLYNVRFPLELEELHFGACYMETWPRFPPKLKILTFKDTFFESYGAFPGLLRKIHFYLCTVEDYPLLLSSLPLELKELSLTHCKLPSLAGIILPDSIEVLDLLNCSLNSIADFKFPKSLKDINLKGNNLSEIGDSKFPALRRL